MVTRIAGLSILAALFLVVAGSAAPLVVDGLGDEPVTGTGCSLDAARADAARQAVRQIVARYADVAALEAQQIQIERSIFSQASQFCFFAGEPTRDPADATRWTFPRSRVYLSGAAVGHKALLPELRRLGVLPVHRVVVQVVPDPNYPAAVEAFGTRLEAELLDLGFQPINPGELRHLLTAAIERQKLEIHPDPGARIALRQALQGNLAELVVLARLDLGPTQGAMFPTVEGTIPIRVWDSFKADAIASDEVNVKPTPGNNGKAAASQAAIAAAASIAARVGPKLLNYLFEDTCEARLWISGWKDTEAVDKFQTELKGLGGVIRVQQEGYAGGILQLTVAFNRRQIPSCWRLMSLPVFKAYQLELDTEGGVIRGKVPEPE